MKSIILTLLLTAFCFAASAAPTTTTTPPMDSTHDSVLTARELALHTPDVYNFNLYVQTNVSGTYHDHYAYGVRKPNGNIVSLNVDGTTVVGPNDPPIQTLPLPTEGGISYISLNLDGNENGKFVTWGSYYSTSFKRGSAIDVLMGPAAVNAFLKYALPAGIDPQDLLVQVGDYTMLGGYDVNLGGFFIYIDPSIPVQNYSVVDQQTGVTLLEGTVTPYDGVITVTPTSSPVSLTYVDGVTDLSFTAEKKYTQYLAQQLDGQVIDPATNVATPAKAYFMRQNGEEVTLYLDGVNGTVEVFDVGDGGAPVSIWKGDTLSNPYNPGTYYLDLSIPGGYTALVIKVTGAVQSGGFSISSSNGPRG